MPKRYPSEFRRKVLDLVAARRRIAGLEAEVAIHRRAAELLKESSTPQDATRRSP